jgi:hypothetical protein
MSFLEFYLIVKIRALHLLHCRFDALPSPRPCALFQLAPNPSLYPPSCSYLSYPYPPPPTGLTCAPLLYPYPPLPTYLYPPYPYSPPSASSTNALLIRHIHTHTHTHTLHLMSLILEVVTIQVSWRKHLPHDHQAGQDGKKK